MQKEHEVILTGSDSEISIEITIPKTVDGEAYCQCFRNRLSSTSGRFFVDIIKITW